jgi:predicted dehydrogenase
MAELQFAIIGTGFWAQFQIGAWKELTGARLVAVCDRDRALAEAVARRFGIPRVYDDAERLIDSEKLDLDACREAGIPFLIHENYRWQEPMRRIRRVLDSSQIGRPCRAHIQFSHGDIRLFDSQPYLFTQPHFAMYDMGPHLLDLLRFFFGEPESVYCHEYHIHPRFQGEDIVSALLAYERLSCHCELSWRTTEYEVFIEGTEGTLKWETSGRLVVTTQAGEFAETLVPRPYDWADPRYGFAHSSIVSTNANLLAALRGEGQAETIAEDNLKTMRLIHLALESARRNQVLPLS